jgi:RNA polymerase sigma-70 factor (ECF subfamily)
MTGDELETLVRMHQAEVYRYVRYLGAESAAVAEDLVQETFLAAFRSSSPPSGADGRVQSAWLRGIARNLFLGYCRHARNAKVRSDSDALDRAEVLWSSQFLRGGDGFDYVEALRSCMQKLADRQRHMLQLQYTEGKSRAEIASLLEMTEDGIKSALRRTRAALAECIKRRLGLSEPVGAE